MNREEVLSWLRQSPAVDVLIIGGGINGIGALRDLGLQGADVLLVERGDFCSGASAASSHMVHGGIRYLENGEFRLVREAVQERNRLIQNAPHYVTPLPTVIPLFKWFSGLFNSAFKFLGWLEKPAERGAVVIKAGLIMYDAYTGKQGAVPRHRLIMRRKSLAQFPDLNPRIIGTAHYYDGSMPSPERICIDLLADVVRDSAQARFVNYVGAVGGEGETVRLRDELSGETFTLRPQIVINAAGPWIDLTNQALGRESRLMGGTKGSHLVLDHPQLRQAIGDNEFFFENKDGRITLIFPLLDKVIVGTSDIFIDHPDDARCTEAEVDYFLDMIDVVFPAIELSREHIVFRFSGVRPLPAANAKTAGQVSRDHSIEVIEAGAALRYPILSLVGGKWTTFRAFAEQVTDVTLARLGRQRRQSTANLPIGGGRDYPSTASDRSRWCATVAAATGLPAERLALLLGRYGTRAADVAAFIAAGADAPLAAAPDFSRREIAYLVTHEMVGRLDDVLLRRTLLGMLGQTTPSLVVELAATAGEAAGWAEARQQAEIERTRHIFADRHGVEL